MSTGKKSMANMKVPRSVKVIDDIAAGYKAYRVLKTATEKGLFDWLDENGGSTDDEIAVAMKINGMFIRSFLQSLVDMGMLTNENELYANTSVAANFLVTTKPGYQGDWLKAVSGKNSKWEKLNATFKVDGPGSDDFYARPDKESMEAQAERSLRGELQAVTKTIEAWEGFPRSKRVLDISGGQGLYAIALCQSNPGLKAVVFDKPEVLSFTSGYISRYSMEDQVSALGGDIMMDDPGNEFDIVIISHILYKFRRDLPAVFKKVSKCMNTGGLIVANHWFCSPGCGKSPGGIMELDKSLNSYGHPLCHPDNFSDSMEKSGFNVLSVKNVPSAYKPSMLFMATKGAEGRKRASSKKDKCECCE